MRHRKKVKKLGRTASHKRALLMNLANQLIEHKEIKTTLQKAKEARKRVDRMITYAKKGELNHRRLAFAFLRKKESVDILFDELASAFKERQGGYTRVIKLGRREGDGAQMALMQLVGFEKLSGVSKPDKKKPKKKEKESDKSKKKIEDAQIVEETEIKETVSEEDKKAETAEKQEETKKKEPAAETEENKETAEQPDQESTPPEEDKKDEK